MFYEIKRVGRMLDVLEELRYKEVIKVTEIYYARGSQLPTDFMNLPAGMEKYNAQQLWGGDMEYFTFFFKVCIPMSWQGLNAEVEIKTGCEEPRPRGEEWGWDATNPQFTAYLNGVPVQGLDINHRSIFLDAVKGGEEYTIFLTAFTGTQKPHILFDAALKLRDDRTEKYYFDLYVPYKIAVELERDTELFADMQRELNRSLDLLDVRAPFSAAYYASLDAADVYLEENYYKKHENKSDITAWCIGHTHIDVAWKWTLAVTRDKARRSFSTVRKLMEKYPEYKFMSSQPQLYKFVQEEDPELYKSIEKLVAEGRWEPEGGMFLEADVVLTAGESLARQMLYGQKFFRGAFGKPSKILWMPDVFGYTGALPQIMKLSGVDYFMTTKIGWNERNCMPYDTFSWEGIDGSRVLTHMSPARTYLPSWSDKTVNKTYTTYNAYLAPSHMMGGWQRYLQKDLNKDFLVLFGYGDGGGGPTREELEQHRRLERGLEGCPRTKIAFSADFFKHLEEDVSENPQLPVWSGELYMEFHRGTYTSMGRNKKNNRRGENKLLATELLMTLSELLSGKSYDHEEMDKAWEILLRNQFHDILPGSAIREVYEDSDAEYAAMNRMLDQLTEGALESLVRPKDGFITVFNPSDSDGLHPVEVEIPAEYCTDASVPMQRVSGDKAVILVEVPAKGFKTLALSEGRESGETTAIVTETTEQLIILTDKYDLCIDKSTGGFSMLRDRVSGRELLKKGQQGNRLVCFEDIPLRYDNWNIDQFYEEKFWEAGTPEKLEITENGSVRCVIAITFRYMNSLIEEQVVLYKDLSRIDLNFHVDWKEKQTLLKNVFPFDLNTKEATYEIQYGNIKRPTHRNTSWDQARFEVWNHRYMDLSEGNYGVSILNDCKYGVGVQDTTVSLTMMKSGIFPNEAADKEVHEFRYAIYPHAGDVKNADTAEQADLFNVPGFAVPGVSCTDERAYAPLSVTAAGGLGNVAVDAVKESEDGKAYIVRLHEYKNCRNKVTICPAFSYTKAEVVNLLEETTEALSVKDGTIEYEVHPYEIVTFKLYK